MEITNDYVNSLYKKFLSHKKKKIGNINKVSDKQIELINQVYNQYLLSIPDSEYISLVRFLENILKKSIDTVNDLTHDECYLVVKYTKNFTISKFKKKMLQEYIIPFYSKEKISQVLGYDYDDILNISNKQYKKLVKLSPYIDFEKKLNNFIHHNHEFTLEYSSNYEIGYQMTDVCPNNRLYYIRFYDFMMIDYDMCHYDKIKERLNKFIEFYPEFVFKVYQTYNGYHVFVISNLFNFNCKKTITIMKLLACDPWYIIYSYNSGFKIRLNSKINQNNGFIHKYIETIGNKKFINDQCIEYDKLMFDSIKKYNKI